MPMDRLEPAFGTGEEIGRRHHDERDAVVEGAEPGADEPHVVVERQPAHEQVVRADVDRTSYRPDVREHVGVGQDHALRIAGAARRVLQKCRIEGAGGRARRRHGFPRRELGDGRNRAQRRRRRPQQPRDRTRLRDGDEDHRESVVEDSRLPREVLLELRAARRRVDRHRHASGVQDAEEGEEEIERCRQHDRDALPGLEPARPKSRGDARRAVGERPVGERRLGRPRLRFLEQREVRALRMRARVPVEHVGERLRVVGEAGDGRHGLRRRSRRRGRRRGRRPRSAGAHCAQQIARGFGAPERTRRQAHSERALEPQQQLRALDAVETEIPLEVAVELDARRSSGGSRLREELGDDGENRGAFVVGRRSDLRHVVWSGSPRWRGPGSTCAPGCERAYATCAAPRVGSRARLALGQAARRLARGTVRGARARSRARRCSYRVRRSPRRKPTGAVAG